LNQYGRIAIHRSAEKIDGPYPNGAAADEARANATNSERGMRVALRTRLKPDRVEEYEAAHREVPPELTTAIRAAGVTGWTIWRSGLDLFHVIDCADYEAMLSELERLPVNVAWQVRMGELLEVGHDYSEAGGDAGLPVAWTLEPR
jgi:L-rhamnose mutarotase